MSKILIKSFLPLGEMPSAAIFMSGSGSNAERLLKTPRYSWKPAVIVTDSPQKSRAAELAETYCVPLLEHDIKAFYAERGESRVSLKTEEGRRIREEWTNSLREALNIYRIDFGILAGFIPLSNITSDFPCLNVHPGDLTVEKDGRRLLVGLNTLPVETAILNGFDSLRSSVIIAQTYTGAGGEMDSGPILGISDAVPIDFKGFSLDELKAIYSARPTQRPVGGYKDDLEDLAKHNQTLLKENGDWFVFPPVVENFAAGNYGYNDNGDLFFKCGGEWKKIKTVLFSETSLDPVFV
jgi:folate-dependent phosphoribosylglycinamide formyltransferase PurN